MQPDGTPCWIDLETDLDRALPFYGSVLGWSFGPPLPDLGGWRFASLDGAPVAGIGPGAPRAWQVFMRTDDLDAAVQAAAAAGGEILLPPAAVGEMGRAARIGDPGGAWNGLWQPGSHPGFTLDGAKGSPVWFEVNTRAYERVGAFFTGLFGLTSEKMEGKGYLTLRAEGAPRFGVLQMNAEWDGMDPSWMVYFGAEDVDAAAAAVQRAGGTVPYGPFDSPFGRIAVCEDPLGTAFSLITPAAR